MTAGHGDADRRDRSGSGALASLPGRTRELVLTQARRRAYAPGSLVVRQGDDAASVHFIESGRVSVRYAAPTGESVILAVLGPGDVFGELGLVVPTRERTASTAAIDEVVAWGLRREAFDRLRREVVELDDVLLSVMAQQVDRLTRMVAEVLYVPAERRVGRRLCEVAEVFDDGSDVVTVPLTQEELAQLAGTSRPTANQALRKLEDRDLVQLARGHIDVTDLPGLRDREGW